MKHSKRYFRNKFLLDFRSRCDIILELGNYIIGRQFGNVCLKEIM